MPHIIAPIYEFFNYNGILHKTVKSATFVNSQDERALPANPKCVCPLREQQTKEGEPSGYFRPRIVWYFYLSQE